MGDGINQTQRVDATLAIVPAIGRPHQADAPYPEIQGWVVVAPQSDGHCVAMTGVHRTVSEAATALLTIRDMVEAGISLAASINRTEGDR